VNICDPEPNVLYRGNRVYGLKFTAEPGGVTAVVPRDLPEVCRLEQNYPNPFNPVTTIGYRVSGPGSMWVRLAVYDVSGREVRVLVSERKEPGRHEVRFDGAGLASGVYFYCMQVRPLDSAIGSGLPAGSRDSGSGAGDPSPESRLSSVQTRKLLLLK
jgi:hypothetical protein